MNRYVAPKKPRKRPRWRDVFVWVLKLPLKLSLTSAPMLIRYQSLRIGQLAGGGNNQKTTKLASMEGVNCSNIGPIGLGKAFCQWQMAHLLWQRAADRCVAKFANSSVQPWLVRHLQAPVSPSTLHSSAQARTEFPASPTGEKRGQNYLVVAGKGKSYNLSPCLAVCDRLTTDLFAA